MFKIKVVSAQEMARIEKCAILEGGNAAEFMLAAGKNISEKIAGLFPLNGVSPKRDLGEEVSEKTDSSGKILLLVGRGNNGGDCLIAGSFLLKRGYDVRAMLFFDPKDFSDLCLKNFDSFTKNGGHYKKISSSDDLIFERDEIIIDGIFGTGFKGELGEFFSKCIEKVNLSGNLKVSIDIPSGLSGDDGKAENGAILADHTIFLGLPKSGFFLNDGWAHVGMLHKVDFGLKQRYIDMAEESFFLVEGIEEKDLPKIIRTRNKYEAGFVAGIAGSIGMEGAANLSGKAALRSGAGIVKLFINGYSFFCKEPLTDELVKMELNFSKKEEILSECNKASAIYIGPGIGRLEKMEEFLKYLIPKITKPLVLDADGLYFFAKNPDCKLPENVIMTPHVGEMLRLLNKKKLTHLELISETREFSEKNNAVVILKGAPTFIFKKGEKPTIVIQGDPGMATAGSGDVLTGVIAALLAQGVEITKAAELGAFLHGAAGEAAARDKTSYAMIASDIVEHLPDVFKRR